MQTFAFSTAGRILFGAGTANRVAGEAAGLGRHALLVTGSSPDRAARLRKKISSGGVACTLFQIPHEPDVASVDEGARQARDLKCDVVIGFGGGSVMDGAKARELRIPPLARWGLRAADIPELTGHALRASSMRGNPVTLVQPDIEKIIRMAMREET